MLLGELKRTIAVQFDATVPPDSKIPPPLTSALFFVMDALAEGHETVAVLVGLAEVL
jgi:hypothetical protein